MKRVDTGLVLREASSEEFLPSVRPWVRSTGLVMVSSFVAGVAIMAVWPYRVVVRGVGVVRPRGETSVVHAPFSGRVRKVLVQPNDEVRAGQILTLLDPTDLESKQFQLKQSQRALALQALALGNQGLAALRAAELEVEKSLAEMRFAEAEYRRFQQLAGTGAITTAQLEEKLERYNVASANHGKAQQAVSEQFSRSEEDKALLDKELASTQAEAGQINRDLAKTAIKAPGPGVLFSLSLRNPGQMVAAGEELARIAPTQAGLLVKVQVPSQDITNVEVGHPARLRIAGCPYPDYGTLLARVVSIAPESSIQHAVDPATRSGPTNPHQASTGVYEVTLLPEETVLRSNTRQCELRLGMDLTADITTRVDTVLSFLLRKARLTSGV